MLKFEGNLPPQNPQNSCDLRKKIEKYSFALGDRIGRGFSSIVYKGQNDITNEIVAIKVIELKSLRDQITKDLLQTELKCIKKISHQNLLKYIDSYETVNNCYIITDFCEGGDLQKELRKKGKLTETEIMEFFDQIYSGYQSFMEAGFIHRDLKPANIFLKNGSIRIADFGMVKRTSQNPKDNYNVGTPIYMSPESLNGNIYSEKSDVWSLGVICYQLSHGKLPWRGTNEKQLKYQIQNFGIAYENKYVSHDFINFINCCLDKNPSNRISIKDMAYHPWMHKVRAHLGRNSIPNHENQNIPETPYSLPSKYFGHNFSANILGQKNMNISADNSLNISNSSAIMAAGITIQASIPTLNFENISINSRRQVKHQASKSERPTMDSEMKNKVRKTTTQEAPSCLNSQQQKKSTLDYLVSILNYLRFIFKVYRHIKQYKSQWPSDCCKGDIIEILMTELIVCLKKQEQMAKTGVNVYNLKDWTNFHQSKKWGVYCGVVQQYSIKYRKVYNDSEYKAKEKLKKQPPLSSPTKTKSNQLKNLIESIMDHIQAERYITKDRAEENLEIYSLTQILDYLVSIFNLANLISTEGWIAFVEKSPINRIVQCRCAVTKTNFDEICDKLQKRIKQIKQLQVSLDFH